MTRKYRLPKTHYDLLAEHSPEVVAAARTDADLLRHSTKSVLSVDDHETQHRIVVDRAADEAIREAAKRLGYEFDEFKAASEQDAEAVSFLNRIRAFTSLHFQVALNHELSGRKVFYLSENLTDQLAETELNFPAEELQTPFPTSLFVLQGETAHGLMRKMLPNGNTIEELVDPDIPVSAYVTIARSTEFPDCRVMVVAVWMADPASNRQIAMVKRDLMLKPGWSVEQALKTDWNAERRKGGLAEIDGAGVNHSDYGIFRSDSTDEMFYTDGLQFYRLVINAVLYLMSDAAERRDMRSTRSELREAAAKEVKPKRRREKERFAERFSDSPYILLGETVGEIEDRSRGSGNRLAKRIIVRGHYKNQAHGPGHSQRKHIWIRPYYRGPEMAELVSKPYVVR